MTPAGTDKVDATLSMVRPLIAPGRFSTFFDDCPHSVNKLDRWISKLWLLDIRPVMYMRSDNH